jgi:hypothetical protein
MRADISLGRDSWLYRLDCKKLIVIVFLLRLILASAYDIFFTVTGRDILLPDSNFYSVRGKYVGLLLEGYGKGSFTKDLLPDDRAGREVFIDSFQRENGGFPSGRDESTKYSYIVGGLYFLFGYNTIWIRLFNICLSVASAYLLYRVAKLCFGDLAANLFLLAALFLPTQFGYSITLSRDFLRVFIISLVLWTIYNVGDLCTKKIRSQFCC